jgi:dihydrofolate reductase
MQTFAIVVAIDDELGIGKTGGLSWRLKEDMKYFRELTTSDATINSVIMGRKTWDSIPQKFRPLPNRVNIVLSRGAGPGGAIIAKSLDEALSIPADKIFVIGGGEIYAMALKHPQCSELFITRVNGTYGCDTFFPPFVDRFQLDKVISSGTETGISFQMERWVRTATPRFDLTDAG